MKLSVVILFCDKDYQYILPLLESVYSKMKCEWDLVIVDNTEKYKNPKLVEDINKYMSDKGVDYKVIVNPKNYAQLSSKKQSLEFCKGDYVWFIDGDDDIACDITQEMIDSVKGDLVTFTYKRILENPNIKHSEEKWCDIKENDIITLKFLFQNYKYANDIKPQCWNKWIKKSVLNKALQNVEIGKVVSCGEDNFITLASLKYSETVEERTDCLYINYPDRGFSSAYSINTVEEFMYIFQGYNDSLNLNRLEFKDSRLFDEKKYISEMLCYLLFKVENSKIKEDLTSILKECFGENMWDLLILRNPNMIA